MEDAVVFADPLARIMQLVKDTFGSTFNAYYEGDPILIPDGALPCVMIEETAANVTIKDAPTSTDRVGEKIRIRLVFNKADDFGASEEFDMTERKLRRYVMARDPATGYFMPNTLMYALRTNITLGNTTIDSDVDVQYDLQPRPEKMVTSEAIVTIVVREQVVVPNRV